MENHQQKELDRLKMDEVGVAGLPLCEWCRGGGWGMCGVWGWGWEVYV